MSGSEDALHTKPNFKIITISCASIYEKVHNTCFSLRNGKNHFNWYNFFKLS